MAAVYCEAHGLEMLKMFESAVPDVPDAEEYTKVVTGPLRVGAGGCRCSKCNRPIGPGETAAYVGHYSRNWPEDRGEWDYIDRKKVDAIATFR
jgi:hypothetical protein